MNFESIDPALNPMQEVGPYCSICGARRQEGQDLAEVVNKTTGARSLVHADCYLSDTDCYDLA